MSIKEFYEQNVLTVAKDTSIVDVAKLMKSHNIGNVVVVDKKGSGASPVGIITDRDITIKIVADEVDLKQITVDEAMTEDLLILKDSQGLYEAIDMMCAKGVRRAPVVDAKKNIIGIATIDDLIVLIAEEFGSIAKLIRKQTFPAKKTAPLMV